MTMQMRDDVLYEDERWALWGAEGENFFKLSEFGLRVKNTVKSTACYKRYHCIYEIQHSLLKLQEIEINMEEDAAPLLHGSEPLSIKRDSKRSFDWGLCGNLRYLDVALPIQFSRRLAFMS